MSTHQSKPDEKIEEKYPLIAHLETLESGSQKNRINALNILAKNFDQLDCRALVRLYEIVFRKENETWINGSAAGKLLKIKLG